MKQVEDMMYGAKAVLWPGASECAAAAARHFLYLWSGNGLAN